MGSSAYPICLVMKGSKMQHEDEYLANLGHRNWSIGDLFMTVDGCKWVVSETMNEHLKNGNYATCYSGDLCGKTKHLSHLTVSK
jgi:hypothetical protein